MGAVLSVLIDFETVAALLGRKADKATRLYLWRGIKAGSFPAAIQLSPARIAWKRQDVEAWIASRPTVAYAQEVAHVA